VNGLQVSATIAIATVVQTLFCLSWTCFFLVVNHCIAKHEWNTHLQVVEEGVKDILRPDRLSDVTKCVDSSTPNALFMSLRRMEKRDEIFSAT
jgi:hypothetical protein